MNRREELFDRAAEAGIRIVHAKDKKDVNRIAIHLLNPDLDEVENALDKAERDLFETIVMHSVLTWPGQTE